MEILDFESYVKQQEELTKPINENIVSEIQQLPRYVISTVRRYINQKRLNQLDINNPVDTKKLIHIANNTENSLIEKLTKMSGDVIADKLAGKVVDAAYKQEIDDAFGAIRKIFTEIKTKIREGEIQTREDLYKEMM